MTSQKEKKKHTDFKVDTSIGGISFGDKANPLENSSKTYQDPDRPASFSELKAANKRPSLAESANASAVSIRDI